MAIDTIKMLLGITDASKDNLLNYLNNAVTTEVKKYCRIKVIPDELQVIINDLVVDRFRSRGYGASEAPKTVSSISEGDVSISFKTVQYGITAELTDAEKQRLVPYRRLYP